MFMSYKYPGILVRDPGPGMQSVLGLWAILWDCAFLSPSARRDSRARPVLGVLWDKCIWVVVVRGELSPWVVEVAPGRFAS